MNIKQEIKTLQDPLKIREAVCASSPKVLTFAFERDPHVCAVISSGPAAVPLIAQVIHREGARLNEISLACFAYILDRINRKAASEILRPLYPKLADQTNSFATIFVAHTLRAQMSLPVRDREFFYTPAELKETLQHLKKRSK